MIPRNSFYLYIILNYTIYNFFNIIILNSLIKRINKKNLCDIIEMTTCTQDYEKKRQRCIP